MQNPTWRPPYQTYGYSEPDTRERLAGLERSQEHIEARLNETIERIADGEQQKGRLAHRVGNLEMINSGRSALELRLADLPEQMLVMRAEVQHIQARLKTVLFIGLALLGALGWMPPEVKSNILRGLLPPGPG
jgi:hypothetical protein